MSHHGTFEGLEAWQRAKQLMVSIEQLQQLVPCQLSRKAATTARTIPATIAVGRERNDPLAFVRFLKRAKDGCARIDSYLCCMHDEGLLAADEVAPYRELVDSTARVIKGLHDYLVGKHGLTTAASSPPSPPFPSFTSLDALIHGMVDGGVALPDCISTLAAPWMVALPALPPESAPSFVQLTLYRVLRQTIATLLREIVVKHTRVVQETHTLAEEVKCLSAENNALHTEVARLDANVEHLSAENNTLHAQLTHWRRLFDASGEWNDASRASCDRD